MSKLSAEGVVQEVRAYQTKAGQMYSIKMNGVDYSTGKTKPEVTGGDRISLTYVENGQYKNADLRSITVLQKQAEPSVGTKEIQQGSPYGKSSEQQIIISRQAARNTAIQYLELLRNVEAIPFPASAGTPKKRFDIMAILLEQLTQDFFDYSQGNSKKDKVSNETSEGYHGADWEE